jgi:hypothetical protein
VSTGRPFLHYYAGRRNASKPAVDSCSEVQRWDFDPMLVEVEAGLTSPAVLEVALAGTCVSQALTSWSWSWSRLGDHRHGPG